MRFSRAASLLLLFVSFAAGIGGHQTKIYWADEVPKAWTGVWTPDLLTVAERTKFTRTVSTPQLHEWIAALKLKSEFLHTVSMFTSPMRKVAPAIVIANPRVTSPQQARQSGKPVVFLLGNIHPPESEAAEALMMVARDLATGKHPAVLQNLIVMIAPVYNVDGTDTFVTQDGGLETHDRYLLSNGPQCRQRRCCQRACGVRIALRTH